MSAYHYSPNDIGSQALWYASFIVRRGSRSLLFYPRRKSATAHANQFRRRVLELLLARNKPHGENAGTWLTRLEKLAEETGFTINEVDIEDYQ